MRFEVTFQMNQLRCIRGTLATISKFAFSDKREVEVYLMYYISDKQIRIFLKSTEIDIVLAIDQNICLNNKCSVKEDQEILSIAFKDGKQFFDKLNSVTDRENIDVVLVNISKEKAVQNEQPFRCLNFIIEGEKYKKFRVEILKPEYDCQQILEHPWIHGCPAHQRKVTFDIDTEHFLALLRMVMRNKPLQAKQKHLQLTFMFRQGRFVMRVGSLRHRAEGKINNFIFSQRKFEGEYTFWIKAENANKISDLMTVKVSNFKLAIDVKNEIVAIYSHEGVFESMILLKDWIICHDEQRYHTQTKIEMDR